VTETGGEQNTRLERLENDIRETKEKLGSLETELTALKTGHQTMQSQLLEQDTKLDQILVWVAGANKIAGIAAKHWKTGLKFGCGVVTAWGFSNPHVTQTAAFIAKFFGL
jgi:predicted nuclease with TOPRIM domain